MLLIPSAVSLTVLVADAFSVAQVRDAETLSGMTEVHLVKPLGYVLLAPLSGALDAISLLSARQHIAGLLGLLGLWALWQIPRPGCVGRGGWSAFASFSRLLACIVAAYVAAALLPRPMAYLASSDPDTMRIDFHSHTNLSSDARQTFSIESSRKWHRAGGYDAAYVTNHKAFAQAPGGPVNALPKTNGDTIMLPGIEADWMGEHVGILGPERADREMLTADLRDLETRRFGACNHSYFREPILIWNHPRAEQLDKLPIAGCGTTIGVRAIEVANGAPHGMDLVRRKRRQIVELARKHNLALTSGTDNHGWGYVAPNWTLVVIKNWRDLRDDELAARIEGVMREQGFSATRVVERTSVDPVVSSAALAFTVLTVPWRMLTTLSAEERLAWLCWIWAIAALGLLRQRRRARVPALRWIS
jgi:predicted metal-dependent phosphoesterase TrpH